MMQPPYNAIVATCTAGKNNHIGLVSSARRDRNTTRHLPVKKTATVTYNLALFTRMHKRWRTWNITRLLLMGLAQNADVAHGGPYIVQHCCAIAAIHRIVEVPLPKKK